MALADDQRKWDARYREMAPGRPSPHPLAARWRGRMVGGCMLDAACGHGRGIAAAGHLFHTVQGVDLSPVAIDQARAIWAGHPYAWTAGDVAAQDWPRDHFGLVCAFGFTDIPFFERIRDSIRPGGMFLYEGFAKRQRTVKPDLDPAWTSTSEDMVKFLPGWIVMETGETADPPYLVRHAAQRPITG